MTFNRRDLLKGGMSLPFLGLLDSLRGMAGSGGPAAAQPKLLTIFQRGGNDGVNTVVPHGDATYAVARDDIGLTSAQTRDLLSDGYPNIGLHPSLEKLHSRFGNNEVALLHRIGNFEGERSHFTEMHLLETGSTDYSATAKGWVPQVLEQMTLQGPPLFPGLSLSNRMMRMYLAGEAGSETYHLQQPYSVQTNTRDLDVDFANPLSPPSVRIADRVEAAALAAPGYSTTADGAYLRATIGASVDKLEQLRNPVNGWNTFSRDPVAFPSLPTDPSPAGVNNLAKYNGFFARLEEAVFMLSNDLSCVAGVELGGWDTHSNQVLANDHTKGPHAELLAVLDHAIESAYNGLLGPSPFLILVITEFGRTAEDNGSGTDHGVGALYMAVGPQVTGGVYNCWQPGLFPIQDPMGLPKGAVWKPLLSAPSSPEFTDAVEPATDFRVPLIEIARNFLGLSAADIANLDRIGPEWAAVDTSSAPEHQKLGFV